MTLKSIQVQKVLSLVLLFVGLSLNVFSQKKDVSLELYSVNRGLTQSTITSVFIDDRGLVWAGTCDGLNILDGDEIKVLRNDRISPNSLPHNTIRNITQDEDRSILIGTENGACSYNYVTSEFKRFNFDDKGIRDNMFKIVSTPDQLIFFCRDNFEAFYSRKNKTFNYVKKVFLKAIQVTVFSKVNISGLQKFHLV